MKKITRTVQTYIFDVLVKEGDTWVKGDPFTSGSKKLTRADIKVARELYDGKDVYFPSQTPVDTKAVTMSMPLDMFIEYATIENNEEE